MKLMVPGSIRQLARSGPLWLVALLSLTSSTYAWGPHPTITQAALDALGTNDALILHLGAQAQRLTNYSWMADFRRLPFEEPDELFYADDYLLFPGVSAHLDHICPEVKQTFRPYFKRAVQALRTESPANAARWIGSLLHFAEDTGSPPHAAEIHGGVHASMENWVNAAAISIGSYHPELLGEDEEKALEGFLRRMDGLIEFSKPRGQKLRVSVAIGNRSAVEPVVLECALETSRVMADLLHTLGRVSLSGPRKAAVIRGVISCDAPPGMERFAAKVVVSNTAFSTLATWNGQFEFRNLPPGDYEVCAFRPGSAAAQASIKAVEGKTNLCRLALPGTSPNLVRNGDFKLHWVRADAPDCWYGTKSAWEGEIIPLKIGQRYRLTAKFKEGAKEDVLVRWTQFLPHAVPRTAPIPRIETKILTPKENELVFTGAPNMGLLQVVLRGKRQPSAICDSISLIPIAAEK